MSLTYLVMFRPADGLTSSAEVTVDHELDGRRGRAEAQKILAARGVANPQITGWALRGADQDKQEAKP